MMVLETERLTLRPWEKSDAEDLYKYASHPDVGPIAGWAVHTSVDDSRQIICDVLSAPETYAVVLKETGRPVGSIGLMIGKASNIRIPDTEGEIGYWIGVPYWGQGLIPEAVQEIMQYGFEKLNLDKIWCGYFDGNVKSKRVQEKCGFQYHHTAENVPCALPGVLRTEHITCISKNEWKKGYNHIEYRKATIEEAQAVCDIVQGTKSIIYPHFYPQTVVDFFGRLHSIEKIEKDINEGKIDVLYVEGIMIGTGSRTDNHITRVYVLPEYEGRGYGSIIMDHLERDIFSEYSECELDASLPAALFYEHRGYRTVEHRRYDIGNGEVMIYEIMRKNRLQ